jgi:hypothetical protein
MSQNRRNILVMRTAAALATMTITPLSPSGPSGETLVRCCSANLVRLNVPVRFTLSARFQRSSECGSFFAFIIYEMSFQYRLRFSTFQYERHTFAATTTPAQLITPPMGAPVSSVHAIVPSTVFSTSLSTVMSHWKNLTWVDGRLTSLGGRSRSRMEM